MKKPKKVENDFYVHAGIMLSKNRGISLANEHPEILDEWRGNKLLEELAEKYNPHDYEISAGVAVSSIYYCLRELAKKGLVTGEELRRIGREHTRQGSRKTGKITGKKSYENGTACFGITLEKRSEISRKVAYKMGKKYGRQNYTRTLEKMSEEDKREFHRRASIALGHVPFSLEPKKSRYGFMDEKSYAIMLKESGEFSWKDIAYETNLVYGNNRNIGSLNSNYNSVWKLETIC